MTVRVAIVDDHISIVDGYQYRLAKSPKIEVVATGTCGEEIEPLLARHPVDVLLLDINLPTSPENRNPFPVLHAIPRLLLQHPRLNILIISMLKQIVLVEALVDAGVSGYILKDDQVSIQQLTKIVLMIASGGIYFSEGTYHYPTTGKSKPVLTPRQLEALSLCAAYPDGTTIALANTLGISGSTLRNLLSGAYLRLGVRTRAAAIARANQLGLLPSDFPQEIARQPADEA
ncbi:MAG: response regulator transcription factor [Anaerolineales bacterium]|nr:response regulator transcription factor [Anaerolineales bacterium]